MIVDTLFKQQTSTKIRHDLKSSQLASKFNDKFVK